jgi:hypothetical protein
MREVKVGLGTGKGERIRDKGRKPVNVIVLNRRDGISPGRTALCPPSFSIYLLCDRVFQH